MTNVATSRYNSRGPGKLLWEWNGADITQFGDGAGTPDYTSASAGGALSVGAFPVSGADYPNENVLLWTEDNAAIGMSYFLINDLPELPERFVYRARLGKRTTSSGPVVILAMQDATHHFIFGWEVDQTALILCGNNTDGWFQGGLYRAQTAVVAYDSGTQMEFDVMLRDPSTGVDPQVNILARGAGGDWDAYGKGGTAWTPWGGASALYDSSWQSGGTIKKPGIGFYSDNNDPDSWMSELQIFSHPWEQ